MSRASWAHVGASLGQGISQGADLYVKLQMEQNKKKQEKTRLQDLVKRYQNAKTPLEQQAVLMEEDPKLAISLQLADQKSKEKQQMQQFIANEYRKDFGGNVDAPDSVAESIEPVGLGGKQGQVVQPINQGDATTTQTGFTPNAPNRAAQNATTLKSNMPFSKDFMGNSLMQAPAVTQSAEQLQQPTKQQLTPKQEIQRLRAKGSLLEGMQHGAGKGYFDTAKAMEDELLVDKKLAFKTAEQQKAAIKKSREDHQTFMKDNLEAFRGAKEIAPEMKRLKKINASGKRSGPITLEIMKHAGIDPAVLHNPENDEAAKIINKQVRQVSRIFRGKILQTEVENFMKSIPSLMQSEEGMDKVINGILTMNQGAEITYRAQRALLDQYEGQELPFDFDQQVFDMIEPQLDQLASDFEHGDLNPALGVTLDPNDPVDLAVMKRFIRQGGNAQKGAELAKKKGYSIRKGK